jgi:hypothetical protein
VRGGDRLVTLREISVRQQIEDFIGSGTADDAVGIEPEGAPDRLAQDARGTFRIILQMISRVPVGLDRLGEGPNGVSLADSLNTLRPNSAVGLLPGV